MHTTDRPMPSLDEVPATAKRSPDWLIQRYVEDARGQLEDARERLRSARRRVVQLEDAVSSWERLAGELRRASVDAAFPDDLENGVADRGAPGLAESAGCRINGRRR